MRDLIGQHIMWNNPFDNFTQTRYSRFLKLPTSAPHTMFDKVAEKLNSASIMKVKTTYNKWAGE